MLKFNFGVLFLCGLCLILLKKIFLSPFFAAFAAPVRKKRPTVADAVPLKRGRGRPPKNTIPDTASSNKINININKTKGSEGPRKITKKAPVVTLDTSSEEESLPNKKKTTSSSNTTKRTRAESTETPARGRAGSESYKGASTRAEELLEPSVGHKRSNSGGNFNYVFSSNTTTTATTTLTPAVSKAPATSTINPTNTTNTADSTAARSSSISRPSVCDASVPPKPKKSRFEDDSVPFIPVVPVPKVSDRVYPPAVDNRNNAAERYSDQHYSAPVPVVPANTPRFQPSIASGCGFGDALSSYQQQQHLVPPPAPVARPPSVGTSMSGTGAGGMNRWEAYHTELRGDDRRANRTEYAYNNDQDYVPPPLPYAPYTAPVAPAPLPPSRPPPPPTPPPVQSMPPPSVPPSRASAPPSANNFAESRDPRLKNRNGSGKSRFDDTSDPTSSAVPSARLVVPPPQSQYQLSYPSADSRNSSANRDSRDGERPGQYQDAPGPAPVRRDVSATSQGSYSGSDTSGAGPGVGSGAGRGRGKSATLPAWMTAAGGNGNGVGVSVGNRGESNSRDRNENTRANPATTGVPSQNSDPRFLNRYEDGRDGGNKGSSSAAPIAGGYNVSGGGGGGNVRGGGRGRDATLPAWMTNQEFAPPPPTVPPPQQFPKPPAPTHADSYERGGSGGGGGRDRERTDSRDRDRWVNPNPGRDREPDRSNNGWQRDHRDNQRDVPVINRSAQGSNNAFHPSFQEQVDRLRQQQLSGQSQGQGQGNIQNSMPPAVRANPLPTATTSTVKGPCMFCNGRKKLKNCPVDDHVTGMLVTPLLNTANRSVGGTASSSVPCVNGRGCGTPEHCLDQSVGIDSKAANEEAANALLGMFDNDKQEGNKTSSALSAVSSTHPGSTSPVVVLPSSAATPLAVSTVGKGDDMSVERARYLQSKQQHSAEHSASQNKDQDTKKDAEPAAAPVTTGSGALKHGKWGVLSSARSLGLIKLGTKQDDPKKRLEQTRRNSLGAFAATTLAGAGALGPQSMQGDRHCPPSRTARPGKSCLRSGSMGSAGDTDTAASEVSASSSAHNGHRSGTGTGGGGGTRAGTGDGHLKWQDMSGKSLSTRHVYENEFDLEPPAGAAEAAV